MLLAPLPDIDPVKHALAVKELLVVPVADREGDRVRVTDAV